MIDQGFVWVNKFEPEDKGEVWIKISSRFALRMRDGRKLPSNLRAPAKLSGTHSYWYVLPKELLVRC